MKHIAIIGTLLILLILTAGCLDDFSSTLPPCCDGTCDGVKTSVITIESDYSFLGFGSVYSYSAFDDDGLRYGIPLLSKYTEVMKSNKHNVTFSYDFSNGHRHITGIIEDHDAPKCDCCQCKYNEEWERVGGHWESTSCGHASKMWNETPTNGEFITPASVSSDYQCVQKCCGCGGK